MCGKLAIKSIFLKVLLLPFTKVLCQNNLLQKIPYKEVMEGHWSQNLQFLLSNGIKSPRGKYQIFCVFTNHPAVNNGELAAGGSVAVAIGVRDM